MTPSSLPATWALDPNPAGLSVRPLRIGRAPGSCRLTSRAAPAGVCPASRVRAWATIVAAGSIVTASSARARVSLPRTRPLSALGTARRPLRSTAAASAAAFPARSARPALTRRIAAVLWSLPSLLRARIWAAISRARRPAARRRSVTLVPVAPPAARTRRAVRASPATAVATSPTSAGYATFAATTVVSARTRPVRSSFCPAAFAHSASFSPATAPWPHRLASFISVAGCGTRPSSPIRQNRRQPTESLTSAHRLS